MPSNQLSESLHDHLRQVFKGSYRRLVERVERWTLTAAPLNPRTYPKGNTLQQHRWAIPQDLYPYLYAPEEECRSANDRLLAQTIFMASAPSPPADLQEQLLQEYEGIDENILCPRTSEPITIEDIQAALNQTSRLGRSELNVAFTTDLQEEGKLEVQDLSWVKPPYHLFFLRDFFAQHGRLLSKVQTKAYLTDRRQTGAYPTNREQRWETHPESPQFATFGDCIQIEVKLLAQVLEFSGAPTVDWEEGMRKQALSLIGDELKPDTFRCPISGQHVDYAEFIETAEDPVHGRSRYQAAHLVPLATEGGRHIVENVSWITELGNRVQGEDALDDITEQIFAMALYHKQRLNLTWGDVEEIAKRIS